MKAITVFAGLGLFLVGLAVLMALPVMLLWNGIMPDITQGAVTPISFMQALGLSLLCSLLFKSNSAGYKEN